MPVKMTSNERILAAVNFRKPDRIPVWDNYWPDFVREWRRYKGFGDDATPEDYYEIDASMCSADESLFPSQRRLLEVEGPYQMWNDGYGRIRRIDTSRSNVIETVDILIHDYSDLDKVDIEPSDSEIRYAGFDDLLARLKAAGRFGFAKVGGLYTRAHFMRREDQLLLDMATDPGFCDALFDKILEHETGMALQTLRHTGSWEAGLWVHDNIGNSRATMFSPAMFERYFQPRYSKLISTCKEAGCKHVYFNSNGNLNGILDLLLDAGFDGFQPLEPSCGMDLFKLRAKYGKRIVFFGGVCNSKVLPRGDRAEIERHVLPLIELGSEGGLVIGTHTIGSDISPETYDFFIQLVRRHGTWA